LIRPPRLREGDPIRVVAPSGPVPRDGFLAGLEVLKTRYEVRHDEGIFARDGYLAGPDERRLAELQAALAEPGVKAVVMARGGYGLLRILPFLDAGALRASPRALVGFSDGTALLGFAARGRGLGSRSGGDPARQSAGGRPAVSVAVARGTGARGGARRPG